VVKSLNGIEYLINIYVRYACGSLAPRQRGSFGGAIRSFQQKDILDGLVEQMKMVLSLLCVEVAWLGDELTL